MIKSKKALLRELCSSLRADPASWRWTYSDRRYLITHISGVALWVGGGECHVYEPKKITFGFWGWLRLRSAFRSWRRLRGNGAAALHADGDAAFVLTQFLGSGRAA